MNDLPLPPPCTEWCELHPHEWHVHPAAVTKRCTRTLTPAMDASGEPVRVVLERFADYSDGAVNLDPEVVRVEITDTITRNCAAALGDALSRLAA